MSEQKTHQLVLLGLTFAVIVFAALLILEPIYGVMWLLASVLFAMMTAIRRPEIWRMEKERLLSAKAGISRRIKGDSSQENSVYDVEFHPDHALVELNAKGSKSHTITQSEFLIGRGKKCHLVLDGDGSVSAEHCRILYRKYSHAYYIEDLRSRNGTYIGARRLEPFVQEKLLDREEITLGRYHFRFEKRA